FWGERGALLTGIFLNPNALASYLMLLPALSFAMAVSRRWAWQRVLLVSCGTLLGLHLLLLLSRAASLTMLAAMAVTGVASRKLNPWIRGLSLGAVLLLLSGACYALFSWKLDNSICLRLFIWQGFLDSALMNPFGYGWNGVVVFN